MLFVRHSLPYVFPYKTKTSRLSFFHSKVSILNKIENKQKLISISPGGFKGFYMMGIITFLKETYDLSDYIFSGASAGSWNAILCTYKGNLTDLITKVIGNKPTLGKNDSIQEFEQMLKLRILTHTKDSDFDLSRVFIGVTTLRHFGQRRVAPQLLNSKVASLPENFGKDSSEATNKRAIDHLPPNDVLRTSNDGGQSPEKFGPNLTPEVASLPEEFEQRTVANSTGTFIKTSIFSNFVNLEDALNCCISSSHIPLITGGFINKYKDSYAFDGGFSQYPYYTNIQPTLHITPGMWEPKQNKSWCNIEDYTSLLSKGKYNFHDLFHQGYEDTKKNREKMDKLFLP